MRKHTRTITNVCLGVFLTVPGLIAGPAMAEVVEWNGESGALWDIPVSATPGAPEDNVDFTGTLAPTSGGSSNTVTANSGMANNIVGGFTETGDASNNTVIVKPGVTFRPNDDFGNHVYGGFSASGNADNNVVNMTVTGGDSLPRLEISGGASYGGGTTNGNSVNLSVSAVDDFLILSVKGGQNFDGDATENVVTVSVSGQNNLGISGIVGGDTWKQNNHGDASSNRVSVSLSGHDMLEIGGIAGGNSSYGNANNNHIDVSMIGENSLNIASVIGGYSEQDDGDTSNNVVNVFQSGKNNQFIGFVYGGSNYGFGNANNNSVRVSQTGSQDAHISTVYSGRSDGEANNNTAHVETSGTVENIIGGAGTMGASNNTLYVKAERGGGDIRGGSSRQGAANNNSVIVSLGTGGSVSGDVIGGESWLADANGNTAIVRDSFVNGDINLDKKGNVIGGMSMSSDANGNTVIVQDSFVNGDAISGENGDVIGGESTLANANGNTVFVRDSFVNGDIIGGIAVEYSGQGTGAETAHNNTVTVEGATNIGGKVFGGYTGDIADVYRGNTLNLWNYTGTTVTEAIGNFENYNFILSNTITTGDTVISTASVDFGAGANVTAVDVMPGGQAFKPGDYVILIDAGTSTGTVTDGEIVQGSDGQFRTYNWIVGQEGTSNLYARLASASTDPGRTDPIIGGRMAGLAFLSDSSMEIVRPSKPGITPFFISQGGRSSYDASSADIDINGFNAMGGLAWNEHFDEGKLMIAAFAEGGWGSYDTKSSAGYNGDGDTHFYGGGIMGRFDLPSTPSGNLYAEASFRAGYASTDFESNDLRDFNGTSASYDTSSHYLRGHAGIGYQWTVTETSGFDLYSRYFWTQLGSDDVSVWSSRVHFDSIDSHKWRTGGRYNHTVVTESGLVFKPYFGAAYEHEFGSTVEGSVDGIAFRGDDLKGGTMMSEIGLSFSPSVNDNLHAELGVQGYLGQRVGVNGQFRIKYTF